MEIKKKLTFEKLMAQLTHQERNFTIPISIAKMMLREAYNNQHISKKQTEFKQPLLFSSRQQQQKPKLVERKK